MAEKNRLRCPRCGLGYTGDIAASELGARVCKDCGVTVELQEEDPDGLFSGLWPPWHRLLALVGAVLFCVVAIWLSLFAVLAFGCLIYLCVEAFQSHNQLRADRIVMWNRLRTNHSEMHQANKTLTAELEQTRQALAESSDRYERVAPERRDRLAKEIVAQQKALGLLGDVTTLKIEKDKLDEVIRELKARIISFEEEELLQSFGFYQPLYNCVDSAAYSQLLNKIRTKQKQVVKEGAALRTEAVFATENNKSDIKKMTKNLEKLILRAFNGECDATIDKVTFSNLDAITARINKAYQDLNDLCQSLGVSIAQSYLSSKIEELNICYEYQMKLKEEREEQRKIREEMREQARLVKEIEDARRKIEKEETHFNQVIAELKARMDAAAASEKEQYEVKLREYQEQLAAVQKDKEEVAFREQSTRAGYVYIISNIGSFGENAYKIGVTRRLEPQERVDELGGASVPFEFDVHAMIFSDDAPALETALHERFADRAVNKVNNRKEFFRVTLDEIEAVVKKHHNKVVEFTRVPKAEDFRISLAKERAIATSSPVQLATGEQSSQPI